MNGFSTTDTATEGLRLTWLRSRAVLIWVLAYLGFTILLARIAELTLGPHAADLLREIQQANHDSDDVFWSLALRTLPFWAVGLPVFFGFQAVLNCAIYRAVLRPQESATGYVRLGADELRMTALILIKSLIWIVVFFLVSFVTTMVILILNVFASPLSPYPEFAFTLTVLGFVGWLWVRLSLSGAMTFSERRLLIFKSWNLTKGRFWPLFGAYLMVLMLWAFSIIIVCSTLWVAGEAITLISGVNLRHLEVSAAEPLIFLAGLFVAAEAALILTCSAVIITAPFAEAYRELSAPV